MSPRDTHPLDELLRVGTMTLAELETLVCAFENTTLPLEIWRRHATHLAVSTYYLSTLPLAEATERIRAGIQRYNAAHGIAATPTSGCHETVTLAFVKMLSGRLRAAPPGEPFERTLESVLRALGDKRILLEHYTWARLSSLEARLGWVEPD